MAPLPAAAGSTAAFIPASTRMWPTSARPLTTWGMAGDLPGLTMYASCITALLRVLMASLGANARSLSGGMRRSRSGRVSTRPDFDKKKRPDYRPPDGAKGMDAHCRRQAVCAASRRCWMAVCHQRTERRAACRRIMSRWSRLSAMPCIRSTQPIRRSIRKFAQTTTTHISGDERFPFVLTTYRLTEHHTAGGMSRTASASRGTTAGAVLRGFSGTCGGARSASTATGRPS